MSLPETNRFRSVEQALSYAFAMEAKRVAPQSLSDRTGGGDNLMERIADGMMVRSFCLRHAGMKGKDIIIAHYTVPVPELQAKKQVYIERCATWMISEIHRDRWCLADGIREWAGDKPHHDPKWWSDHLNKSVRTIQRWWYSKDPADKSVSYLMRVWEGLAVDRITPHLKDLT